MIIRKIALENIKSYKTAEIELTDGITGIAGLNGAGKSTVLEAIGYALFDCLAYTQSEFVRKGEKTGKVAITFEGADGIEYTVTRKCGASQAYHIENEQGIRLCEGKDDVGDMLCELLGYRVNELKQLRALFENAIGVLQGTFVSEFLESRDKRKAIFNPLLRIEEYDLASKNMLSLKNLVERRIDTLENEKKFLEGRADKLATLEDERKKLQDESGGLAAQSADKKRLLDEARAKKEMMDAAEKVVRELEARQRVAMAELAAAGRDLETARRQHEAAEASAGRLRESEPGYIAYKAKLEEKDALEKKRVERDEVKNAIDAIHNQLTGLKALDGNCDRTLAEIAQAEKELPALEQKAGEQERLEEEKAKVASLIGARDMELAQVKERMARAKGSKGNLCPVLLGVECASVQDFSSYFGEQVKRIEADRAGLLAKMNEIAFKIKALGNAKVELGVRRETVRKREKALAEKAAVAQDIQAKNAELMPLVVRLSGFGPLLKSIEALNAEIKNLRPHYEAYQQNLKLAGQKDDLQKALAKATALQAQHERKLREIGAELEEKQRSYDRDGHGAAKSACETLSGEIASIAARMEAGARRLAAVNADIGQIALDLTRIKEIENGQAAEREYLGFIERCRSILKLAGPEIVKFYIDYISREATSMYCEIASDRRVEIRWTPDYDILLVEDGRERAFRQLSGGEQMSAALAVRLAILKILTSSDVVFLDEPTQNMDESRRQNLAQEILRIKGFRQMIVISHDDTFNANLENVIEIEKVNGESGVRGRPVA
ncbi:MAG: DNA double-strand break repair Rad50 ATPase [Methanocella sp. PtaU1.Bin125]|nr:MAG: DNA double-strand break repair Rad50 ATPase [Methanocella sp. PtaU1.Bin125]